MVIYDFDKNVQDILNNTFADISAIDWKRWLNISSPQEFEEVSLKLSGLNSVSDLNSKISREKTNPNSFSLNVEDFLKRYNKPYTPIICHTSGTTNTNLSALKWFFMSKEVVRRNWAPGMQAIFESSGLTKDNSAIIFVPSRIKHDGLQNYNEQKYISLYSSEFSQRVMLSIIKPESYFFYEYKYSKNLEILAKMLQLENVACISAPALTILGWADRDKLKEGIARSLQKLPKVLEPALEKLISIIKTKGLEEGSRIIQKELSRKLSKATIIFSISSLSEKNWEMIRSFMNWEKKKEKFTNLYVISEVGPFAASISKEDYINTHFNDMFVFPLSLAALEAKNKMIPIFQISKGYGKLYVSRMDDNNFLINIDLGDVISVLDTKNGLPLIEGKILRSSFKLNYPIKISNFIKTPKYYELFAGDYFTFRDFIIMEPRRLLFFLKEKCNYDTDSMVLVNLKHSHDRYKLILPYSKSCTNELDIVKIIIENESLHDFHQIFENKKIDIELIDGSPVDFLETRENILKQVRTGQTPKGILKKWPLYVIQG